MMAPATGAAAAASMPGHGFPALRPAQAAERLGVSVATIYRLRMRPDFPKAIPITGRVFCFAEADIDAWAAAQNSL